MDGFSFGIKKLIFSKRESPVTADTRTGREKRKGVLTGLKRTKRETSPFEEVKGMTMEMGTEIVEDNDSAVDDYDDDDDATLNSYRERDASGFEEIDWPETETDASPVEEENRTLDFGMDNEKNKEEAKIMSPIKELNILSKFSKRLGALSPSKQLETNSKLEPPVTTDSQMDNSTFSEINEPILRPRGSGTPSLSESIQDELDDVDLRAKAERHKPVTKENFLGMFDSDGRVVDETELRRMIFKGGVDDEIREEAWKFLFELYPCNSTTRERVVMKTEHAARYRALKARWRPLLRQIEHDPKSGVRYCPEWLRRRKVSVQTIEKEGIVDVSSSTGKGQPDDVAVSGQETNDVITSDHDEESNGPCSRNVETKKNELSTVDEDVVEREQEEDRSLFSVINTPSGDLNRDLSIVQNSDETLKSRNDREDYDIKCIENEVATKEADDADLHPIADVHGSTVEDIREAITEAMMEDPRFHGFAGMRPGVAVDVANRFNAAESESDVIRGCLQFRREDESNELAFDDKENEKTILKIGMDFEGRTTSDKVLDVELNGKDKKPECIGLQGEEDASHSEICRENVDRDANRFDGLKNYGDVKNNDIAESNIEVTKKKEVDFKPTTDFGRDLSDTENIKQDFEERTCQKTGNLLLDIESGNNAEYEFQEEQSEDLIFFENDSNEVEVNMEVSNLEVSNTEVLRSLVLNAEIFDQGVSKVELPNAEVPVTGGLSAELLNAEILEAETSDEEEELIALENDDLAVDARENGPRTFLDADISTEVDNDVTDGERKAKSHIDIEDGDERDNEGGVSTDLISFEDLDGARQGQDVESLCLSPIKPTTLNLAKRREDTMAQASTVPRWLEQHLKASSPAGTKTKRTIHIHEEGMSQFDQMQPVLTLKEITEKASLVVKERLMEQARQPPRSSTPVNDIEDNSGGNDDEDNEKNGVNGHLVGTNTLLGDVVDNDDGLGDGSTSRSSSGASGSEFQMRQTETRTRRTRKGDSGTQAATRSLSDSDQGVVDPETGECWDTYDKELSEIEMAAEGGTDTQTIGHSISLSNLHTNGLRPFRSLKKADSTMSLNENMLRKKTDQSAFNLLKNLDESISKSDSNVYKPDQRIGTSPIVELEEHDMETCIYCGNKYEDLTEEFHQYVEIQAKVSAARQVYDVEVICQALRIIDKDVPRTDRELLHFRGSENPNLLKLRDALITYAFFHPDVGYAQGMNDIMSRFLVVMESEADAYWMFCNYMDHFKGDFMESDMLKKICLVEQLLMKMDRELYEFLQKLQLELIFCHRWLLLSFKREFSYKDGLRIFEIISSRHLEVSSVEAEMERSRERARELEKDEGNRMEEIFISPEYSFDVFVCVAMLHECRDLLMGTNDVASIYQLLSRLPQVNDLDTILSRAEDLFFKYCRKSTMDCFQVIDEPIEKAMSWRQRLHIEF